MADTISRLLWVVQVALHEDAPSLTWVVSWEREKSETADLRKSTGGSE
jgi:hypothetical protein